ncbi:MAG TPA: RNA-binding cell elongation regulator Jag/EloR [Limnochordales bacterium]
MRVVEKSARTVDEAVAEALRELGASRDQVEIEVLEEGSKGLFGLLGAKQARVRVRVKEGVAGAAYAAVTAAAEKAQTAGETGRAVDVAGDAVEDADEGLDAEWEVSGDFAHEEASEEAARPAGPPDEARVARARDFLSGVLERMDVDAALETRIDEDGTVHINIVGRDLGLIIGRRGQTLDALQFLVNQVANRGEGRRVRIILDAEGYRARRAEALSALARRMAARARRLRRKVALEPMNAVERRIVHLALADDPDVETYSEGEEPHRRVIIVPRDA